MGAAAVDPAEGAPDIEARDRAQAGISRDEFRGEGPGPVFLSAKKRRDEADDDAASRAKSVHRREAQNAATTETQRTQRLAENDSKHFSADLCVLCVERVSVPMHRDDLSLEFVRVTERAVIAGSPRHRRRGT